MNTLRTLVCALCLGWVFVSTVVAQQRPSKPKYLSAAEIMKLVENSKVTYRIKTAAAGEDDLADPMGIMFPKGVGHLFYPVVNVGEHGERSLSQYQFDPAAFALIEEAEPYFKSNDYEKARELCQQAINTSKDCYLAYAHLGDSWLFVGSPETALPYYDSALAINKYDYQPYFYKANALLKSGRFDEARQQYIEVLAMNPRHDNTYLYLREHGNELGIRLNDELFRPMVVAQKSGDAIDITLDDEQAGAVWMAYGLAKGIWLGEPEHRKELTGSTDRSPFSTVEETECIAALLTVYSSQLDEGKIEHDVQLDRILKIVEDGYLTEFLIYEFGSRISPDIVLMQPEEFQASMREFIAKYVVVRKG
jgi:tetratricopeptide (TPR) repeat protein